MSTNWRYETYRHLYVREEGSFARLPAYARGYAAELLKVCDHTGRIHVREGKPLHTEVCRILGGHDSDRKLLRAAVPALMEDGYLLEEGPGVLRIRNFEAANPRRGRADGGAQTHPRTSSGGGSGSAPPRLDGGSTTAPPRHDGGTTSQVTAENRSTSQASSFLPDLPSEKLSLSTPVVQAPKGEPIPGPEERQRAWTAWDLASAFGARWSAVLKVGLSCRVTPSQNLRDFAAWLPAEMVNDVVPTMDLALERIRARAPGWEKDDLEKPAMALGAWMGAFTSLVAELRGLKSARVAAHPPVANDIDRRTGGDRRAVPRDVTRGHVRVVAGTKYPEGDQDL